MSTLKFNQWLNPDNTENFKCRAWVNFNGTGTVVGRAAGNVSSITDNGVGSYTINFVNAMADTSYAVVTGAANQVANADAANNINSQFTTSFTWHHIENNSFTDTSLMMAAVYR